MIDEKLEDKIYKDIKDRILSGELKENTKISERTICEEYATSRPIVRIAIDRLKKGKWLYVKPKSGTYISPIDIDIIKDTFQVRLILEPQIISLAIPSFRKEDIIRMKNNCNSMENRDDEKYAYSELDNHNVIKERTNNKVVIKILDGMMETILRITSKTSVSENRRNASINEWRKIIEYIELGDSDTASKYMIQHLINTSDAFWSNYNRNQELQG